LTCATINCSRVIEVTVLETDRRLTLSDTDTDLTRATVVKVRILERSISSLNLVNHTDLFETDLTCVGVLFTETDGS
jgi:hypothetical protein